MNILYAANNEVIHGLELSIWTLLKYNKNVNIYIGTMNIAIYDRHVDAMRQYLSLDGTQRDWLKKIVSYLDPESNICFIDCEEYYHTLLEGGVNEDSNFTPFAAIRLMADEMLPDIDDILYLDCDTAIQGNIEAMYHDYIYNNSNCYAISCAYDAFDGLGEDVSGVFLMNLRKMRETNFLSNARELYKTIEYRYPDQMAIRDTGKGTRLPATYGYMDELEKCPYDPIILHFTNNLAPKIYNKFIPNIEEYFFKRYPQFKYVKDGLNLLSKIDTYKL